MKSLTRQGILDFSSNSVLSALREASIKLEACLVPERVSRNLSKEGQHAHIREELAACHSQLFLTNNKKLAELEKRVNEILKRCGGRI